jgi:uncharacterized zinc-type alcohol dehydrogenase-like protein
MSKQISLVTKAFAAQNATSTLTPFSFERREPRPHDILIEIEYCGVCHSDIHQVRNEWGNSLYPMVPGHEIVGKISRIGSAVKKFKVGDLAGVGCLVDSCRTCNSCKENVEQYCENGNSGTYNSLEQDKKTITFGGYSTQIVVDEKYALKISEKLSLSGVAPLLCAGITTYSPLRTWKVGRGHKVAVVGLGGLGHMAVKFASSFGAQVTMLSSSPSKQKDAEKLGAHAFACTKEASTFSQLQNSFDFILDTVSAPHDYNAYLSLLKRDGTMILVGAPNEPTPLFSFPLILKRRRLVGSLIGGIKETQEMLDYCAEKNITSDVEVIPIQKINEAYERMIKGDVRYRFVIDTQSLNS